MQVNTKPDAQLSPNTASREPPGLAMQSSAVRWDHMSTRNQKVLPACGILQDTQPIQAQITCQALNIMYCISLFWPCLACRYLFRPHIRIPGYTYLSRHLLILFSFAIPTNFLCPAEVRRSQWSLPLVVVICLCFFLGSSTPTRGLTPCLNLYPGRINGTDIILHILFGSTIYFYPGKQGNTSM